MQPAHLQPSNGDLCLHDILKIPMSIFNLYSYAVSARSLKTAAVLDLGD